MSLHKLTAGDGYTYLARQVAAGDSTERGRSSLVDYYAEKGETPRPAYGPGQPVASVWSSASIGSATAPDWSPPVHKSLRPGERERWDRIAHRLRVPFHTDGIISQSNSARRS